MKHFQFFVDSCIIVFEYERARALTLCYFVERVWTCECLTCLHRVLFRMIELLMIPVLARHGPRQRSITMVNLFGGEKGTTVGSELVFSKLVVRHFYELFLSQKPRLSCQYGGWVFTDATCSRFLRERGHWSCWLRTSSLCLLSQKNRAKEY